MSSMKQLPSRPEKLETQQPEQAQTEANSDKKTQRRSKRSESLGAQPPDYEILGPESDGWRGTNSHRRQESNQAGDPRHSPQVNSQQPIAPRKSVAQLLAAANAGDTEARVELERILEEDPATIEKVVGLSTYAKKMWLNTTVSPNEIYRKLSSDQLEKLRQELSAERSSERLEQILIDQVVMSQLQLASLDAAFAKLLFSPTKELASAISISTKAHARLMKSINTLAMLRSVRMRASAGTQAGSR